MHLIAFRYQLDVMQRLCTIKCFEMQRSYQNKIYVALSFIEVCQCLWNLQYNFHASKNQFIRFWRFHLSFLCFIANYILNQHQRRHGCLLNSFLQIIFVETLINLSILSRKMFHLYCKHHARWKTWFWHINNFFFLF